MDVVLGTGYKSACPRLVRTSSLLETLAVVRTAQHTVNSVMCWYVEECRIVTADQIFPCLQLTPCTSNFTFLISNSNRTLLFQWNVSEFKTTLANILTRHCRLNPCVEEQE